jgi:N-methylhydantoinase B
MVADPILLEVFNNALISVGEEMAATMKRTARSMSARGGDCSTVLADSRGEIIAQGQGTLFHVGYAQITLPGILKKWTGKLRPGDMVAVNDPYQGMSHLPDIVLTAPVFWKGEIVAYVMIVAHQTDIGGRFPGGQGMPCAEIFEEGIIIPNIKLYHEGRPDRGLLEMIAANVRAPSDVVGDIEALAAACRRGIRGMEALLDKYGRQTYEDCIAQLKNYSERLMRAGLTVMPDGDYTCEEHFEEDGVGGDGVKIRLTLKKRADSLVADFTGTDPQVRSAINVPWGNTCSSVYLTCWYMLAPDAPANGGLFRPITVLAPEGCLLNPRFPGAVGARGMMLWRLTDVISAALGRALPDRAMAEGDGGTCSLTYITTDDDNKAVVMLDWYQSGWGARPTKDGIDGARSLISGAGGSDTSTEVVESEFPVVIAGHFLKPDTGGPGKYRGALSLCRKFRFLRDGRVLIRTCRSTSVPHGLAGGGNGTPSKVVHYSIGDERQMPQHMFLDVSVKAGDSILHMLPGAAGHGNQRERDPERVLSDVLDGKITAEYAERIYGVAIDVPRSAVDFPRTRQLRGKKAALS